MLSHYFGVENEYRGKYLKHKHVFFILTYRVNIIFQSYNYEESVSFHLTQHGNIFMPPNWQVLRIPCVWSSSVQSIHFYKLMGSISTCLHKDWKMFSCLKLRNGIISRDSGTDLARWLKNAGGAGSCQGRSLCVK